MLAAAVGGYQRSRYAAQQDIAAQRQQQQLFDLKKQQMEAEQAGAQAQADQRTAIMAEIRKLPPGEQTIALLDPEGWAKAKAGQMFPEPAKPMQVGNDLVDPMTGRLVYRAPFAPRDPAQAPETWQTLSPDETRAMGYPEGVVVQRSSRGQLNTSFKPTNQSAGITFETPDGGTLSIGGSSGGQAVKLPQGFYMGDPSPEAQAAGITSKVAAPLPGTPEYAKATESINASTVFRAKLDQMRQLYDEVGTQVMPGEAKGRLESLANDLKLSYALAKGQGALQKTDEQVISSVLGAVTSPMSLLPGGADQVKAQIGQAIQSVDRDISGLVTQYPWARIHGASQNVPSPEVQGQTIMNKSGAREPFYGIALYREYVQTYKEGNPFPMWAKMPANQLAKCAEALALRKAFPGELSGIYTQEEMAQAHNSDEVIDVEPIREEKSVKSLTLVPPVQAEVVEPAPIDDPLPETPNTQHDDEEAARIEQEHSDLNIWIKAAWQQAGGTLDEFEIWTREKDLYNATLGWKRGVLEKLQKKATEKGQAAKPAKEKKSPKSEPASGFAAQREDGARKVLRTNESGELEAQWETPVEAEPAPEKKSKLKAVVDEVIAEHFPNTPDGYNEGYKAARAFVVSIIGEFKNFDAINKADEAKAIAALSRWNPADEGKGKK